jgi:hypothetical protein
MYSVTTMIESGRVRLPAKADWLESYLKELISFPRGKYDDQVDSTSQALDWAKNYCHPLPVVQYIKSQALRGHLPIEPWMLDDEEELPPICPRCQASEVGRRGLAYHCNCCQHEWKRWACLEIHRCRDLDGNILVWDYMMELWVNETTGRTYPPGEP